MTVYCAACNANFPREAFMVTIPESTLLWDGKRLMYARHRRCGFRTVMLRNDTIGRDKTKVR